MEDLMELWKSVEKHSSQRTVWIDQLDEELQKIEKSRSELVIASCLFTSIKIPLKY